MTLWHGRFGDGPADELLAFTASLPFDRRLAPDDIAGSRAHVRGLARVGLLDEDEAAAVLGRARPGRGGAGRRARSPSRPSDEDIHTAVERRVTELAGAGRGQAPHRPQPQRPGGHRPAAVVQARAARWSPGAILGLQEVLLDAGRRPPATTYLPGYTHLQRAQPVLLAHHLLAHGWALGPRRRPAARRRVDRLDVSPLGAGALAGSSLPLDPDGDGGRPRLRRRLRQLARRRQRPRLRGRGAVRPGPARRPPVAHRRGVGAVDERGVRLRPPRRRLRHRLVDAAAEEEPRHRRAGPGQGGPADRQPHRAARHAQGPAARLQPRPPGGQGAAVRRGRPGRAGPRRRSSGMLADGHVRRRAHGRRRRRPTPAATDLAEHLVAGRACRSATPTPSSATLVRARRSTTASPWPSWSRRHPDLRRGGRAACSSPAWRSAGAPRRAAPARRRGGRARSSSAAMLARRARRERPASTASVTTPALPRSFFARDRRDRARRSC